MGRSKLSDLKHKGVISRDLFDFVLDLEEINNLCGSIDRNARSIKADYVQALYANMSLIFARWRRDLPEDYRPIIDFHQERVDREIAPRVKKALDARRNVRVIGAVEVVYYPHR